MLKLMLIKVEVVSKDQINRKERKVGAKYTKLKYSYTALCKLCENPLRTLRSRVLGIANFAVNGFRLLIQPQLS
jgi:hypothetical protein